MKRLAYIFITFISLLHGPSHGGVTTLKPTTKTNLAIMMHQGCVMHGQTNTWGGYECGIYVDFGPDSSEIFGGDILYAGTCETGRPRTSSAYDGQHDQHSVWNAYCSGRGVGGLNNGEVANGPVIIYAHHSGPQTRTARIYPYVRGKAPGENYKSGLRGSITVGGVTHSIYKNGTQSEPLLVGDPIDVPPRHWAVAGSEVRDTQLEYADEVVLRPKESQKLLETTSRVLVSVTTDVPYVSIVKDNGTRMVNGVMDVMEKELLIQESGSPVGRTSGTVTINITAI